MYRTLLLVTVVFCVGLASDVDAQDAAQRTHALAAALDKTKYKKKEKKNISIELYVDIKNEPVIKNNISEYAGVYTSSDSDYRLELRIMSNGTVEGGGYDTVNFDSSQKQNFTLKDARIKGALLTGTKVFDGGQTERLEAIFTNRTVISGKNRNEIATRETAYGLGFIRTHGSWTTRVFLEFRR